MNACWKKTWWLLIAGLLMAGSLPAGSAVFAAPREPSSLANNRLHWPSGDQVLRLLTLRDYNTRVVLMGTTLLGGCAGLVGVFMLLRKRALVGDVVSHSSLPGIAIAFLVIERFWPGHGKSLIGLLIGALIAGMTGLVATMAIRRLTRIKEDAALAIVLSVFFGLGIVLFTIIQSIPTGNSAGLNHFIFGKASSMVAADVKLIAVAALGAALLCGLLFKEFALLCFDEKYARAQGWPVVGLDLLLMVLVAGVTIIGLQSVGLLLVVALLIIPPAAGRFWTDRISRLALVSAGIGGLSALVGVMVSALFPRLAAGAVIVLAGGVFFLASLLFGRQRGVIGQVISQARLRRSVGRHHLLRACFELVEPQVPSDRRGDVREMARHSVKFEELLAKRSWSPRRLRRLLNSANTENMLRPHSAGGFRMTKQGALVARQMVKNHRLWELYLIRYADLAPGRVDRDADRIEHVLEPEVLEELEMLLEKSYPHVAVPESPHDLRP